MAADRFGRGPRPPPPQGFLQPCVAAAMMGDLNAVTVVEHANSRMLLRSGALRLAELLLPGRAMGSDFSVGDIYAACLASRAQ